MSKRFEGQCCNQRGATCRIDPRTRGFSAGYVFVIRSPRRRDVGLTLIIEETKFGFVRLLLSLETEGPPLPGVTDNCFCSG
jgi:hypothetical protein